MKKLYFNTLWGKSGRSIITAILTGLHTNGKSWLLSLCFISAFIIFMPGIANARFTALTNFKPTISA